MKHFQIPFSLCLRIWDIYMIEGERVVTAMAFTILRLHRNKLLKMKDMDLMTDLLQTQLYRDFGYTDDNVIRVLEQSMIDLQRYKMDLPPPPGDNELPRQPLGKFKEPDFDTKVSWQNRKFCIFYFTLFLCYRLEEEKKYLVPMNERQQKQL